MSRSEQVLDLDIGVLEKLLEETRPAKSRLYIWGGEPLVHRKIERIWELLEQDPRETTICTNAYFVDRHIDALCRISQDLDLLIPIEGFAQEHDLLRGKGTFERVMTAIEELLGRRAEQRFHGRIAIHTVITDQNVGHLYELLEFYEEVGVDLVLHSFPWYISQETSREMDAFVHDKFSWLPDIHKPRHTWDSFTYHVSPEKIAVLLEDLHRINERTCKMKVRYQPGLEFDEIELFVRGKAMTPRCATTCSVLTTRADIIPTGDVVACKFFTEFSVGNLHEQTLSALWNGENYNRIRSTFAQQLSPACSKCSVLYLHSHSTPLFI
jgi:radical SAM protein with 4Fe4S-binding SPASM domain